MTFFFNSANQSLFKIRQITKNLKHTVSYLFQNFIFYYSKHSTNYITINGITMKTTKLPQSAWNDEQAAGSQSQSANQSHIYYLTRDKKEQIGRASNDDIYKDKSYDYEVSKLSVNDKVMSNNKAFSNYGEDIEAKCSVDSGYKKADSGYKKASQKFEKSSAIMHQGVKNPSQVTSNVKETHSKDNNFEKDKILLGVPSTPEIPERVFMNGLIKHTAIALAIIIPLAAFSAYAAPQNLPMNTAPTKDNNMATIDIEPSSIIHKSASTPTTVDTVDLEQYAGTWYEIGRLPMYFQRKCTRDVTATYTGKADGSGITVLNECVKEDGTGITAEGLAKPADDSGSKLKVTFLPSWIRWLPVGRADYWVLARDADYKTALVGTPNRKYLWLLARTPNISQQTYAKYRQIAQQQGYELKEFKLTPQTNQHVNLVP